ncbi:MAG: polysaccharide biosynthesis tyrosine autokinase [Sandaracinaceae bacterium]|nr:polysaccharide biosynthesis tyrosine autokinase [Sandaracinaceae bacterium]
MNPRLDDLKRRLESSEIALHEFKRDHDVLSVSMEDRQNLVANAIEQFSQQVTTIRAKRIELSARLGQLRYANREDPFEVHASALAASPEATHLRESYRTKMAEKQALATRYGPHHPHMEALDLEIQALRTQMTGVVTSITDDVAGDLREAQATERGLREALNEANTQGLELNLREIEYSRLNRERENNSKLYGVLLERTTETELGKTRRVSRAQIIDRAIKPTEAISPRIRMNIAGGALAGILLGIGAAFLAARLDRTVKTVEDAEGLGLTVIGMLPSIEENESEPQKRRRRRRRGAIDANSLPGGRDLIVHTRPMSSVAEFCRTIRTNLMFMSADNPLRTILVTSPGPREGKTTVATSIAITLAQSSKRVLLIDTDLRRPRIHRTFDASSTIGTTSVLVGDATLEEAVQETVVPGLYILPCGPIPPNPAELLHTAKFRELVEEASRTFDRVVFDSPPLGAVTDGAIISPQVQGTLLVVKAQHTSRDAVRSSLRQLHDVGANVLGGVLNNVDLSEQNYGYGSYYGGYYYARGNYYTSDTTTPTDPGATPAE